MKWRYWVWVLAIGKSKRRLIQRFFPRASVIRFICTPLFFPTLLNSLDRRLFCTALNNFFLSSFSDVANHLNDDTEAEMGSKDDWKSSLLRIMWWCELFFILISKERNKNHLLWPSGFCYILHIFTACAKFISIKSLK
jgi:hypothetical protein